MSRTVTFLGLLVLAAVVLAAGFSLYPVKPADAQPAVSKTVAAPAAPVSFRFAKPEAGRPEEEPSAPISLTASDGTGLSLVALEADGVLEPPLAFTELHLTFENPRNEVIEGRFRIALPPGAALSRFAMKIDDVWQEGEVVERQRARQAYEDFLHRRQDPALLEQEAGNEFSARVFPIPARGQKEIIVSYSHALVRAEEPYVLPLLGLSKVGQLDVRVLLGDRPASGATASNLGGEVSERRVVELHKRDWTPDRDFEIAQDRSKEMIGRAGLRHANLAVVRVSAPVEAVPQEIKGLYVLVDSSASRALGYATQVRRLSELIGALRNGGTPLGIAAFDQEVVPVFEGTAAGFGPEEAKRLASRRPLGASDLQGALAWLGDQLDQLGQRGGKYPRVLLITDGVATAGQTETRDLKAAVKALGEKGVERLDVLAVGGLRDEAVLHELTTGNLKNDGQRLDGSAPLTEIGRRLTLATRSGIQVAVEGATWVWPDTLDGVQPGDQALVYADLPANKSLRLTLDGRPALLGGEPAPAEQPLLERAWTQARIERLLHLRETAHANDDDLRRALVHEIVDLSVKHRVLSPYTAMLVLETDFDYARFGLDRKALANILTVGPGGLEVAARTRSTSRGERDVVATRKPDLDVERPLEPGEEHEFDGPAVGEPEGVPEGVEGGVPGGVVGGVPGGVAGGVIGGVPSPANEVAQAVEVPSDDAPLRVATAPPPPPPPAPRIVPSGGAVAERITVNARPDDDEEEKQQRAAPYTGRFAEVMKHLANGRIAQARALAESWSSKEPGDVLALLALGEAWEAAGEKTAAARAYGSLIDLFPSRVDMRRLAGERLERLGEAGLDLAIDSYQKAVLDRPDHPTGHRLLAWALLRAGRYEAAFEALEKGIEQEYPQGRFAGLDRVLQGDLGLLGAAWISHEPAKRDEVLDRLQSHDAHLDREPSLRFVLTWETDANDVDLHVFDRKGAHAYYNQKTLPSGGELYEDVTTGYGPECFAIDDPANRDAAPYRLKVHYYRRGPMGYGMGTVQVIRNDGEGKITIEPRPFVVMADDAMVDLGTVKESRGGKAGR